MPFFLRSFNKFSSIFLSFTRNKHFPNYSTSKFFGTENNSLYISCNCMKILPKGLLDDNFDKAPSDFYEKEPLQTYPNNVNPITGEIGGPKGKHN